MPNDQDLLMAKFYTVDGVSYPAAENAVGVFETNGFTAMKACRTFGFMSKEAKGSLTTPEFTDHISRYKINLNTNYNVDPHSHYIQNNGFGVVASSKEIELARLYLVDGMTYTQAEAHMRIKGRKGFESMYSVCKLGAFYGRRERGSLTPAQFSERLAILRLTHPDYLLR